MVKELSKISTLIYSNDELEVLRGVIEYADKMIRDQGAHGGYAALRRHAYGKTVVIETEKKGLLVFRLSSTGQIYPDFKSGYATPHSPVGRLCSVLRDGDEDETPVWGTYRVTETRLFDRFDGLRFDDNVSNFLRMVVTGEQGNATVSDLALTVRKQNLRASALPVSAPVLQSEFVRALPPSAVAASAPVADPGSAKELYPVLEAPLQASPTIAVTRFELADDEELPENVIIEEEVTDDDAADVSLDDYFGLSETFYINRTREQDQVIARSPVGAMFVEGVAGSGKTSAALGRTKMLCDFQETHVTDEAEFRQFAGAATVHWAAKFAGKFSQEGSIGFVRTGELIQYLKETCRRLELAHLPITEFKELQVRLRQHRKVERSNLPGGNWTMCSSMRGTEPDTTMVWLLAADRVLSHRLADRLTSSLPSVESVSTLFVVEEQATVAMVVAAAFEAMQAALKPIQKIMRQKPAMGRYGLDQLGENLARAMRETSNNVLGKNVLWVIAGTRAIYAQNENALASLLIRSKIPLFLPSGARLVVVGAVGPVDASLILLASDGTSLDESEAAAQLADGKALVRDADGTIFPAVATDKDDLFLKLLPESVEKICVMQGGKIRRLRVQQGLGKVARKLIKAQDEQPDGDTEEDEAVIASAGVVQGGDSRVRSIDVVLRPMLDRALLRPLAFLADEYVEALDGAADSFPDPALASTIHAQMKERKLDEADVDLLLCLAQFVGRGFEGRLPQLKPPSGYQSVFIDEVQDFTEQQVFLMAEQARSEFKAVTVSGDIAQKLHHGSRIDIQACFPFQKIEHVYLSENLRQLAAPGLAWFSTCFRAALQGGLAEEHPEGELRERMSALAARIVGPEEVVCRDLADMDERIVNLLKAMPQGQTAAVILPSSELATEMHRRLRPALAAGFVDTEVSEKVDLSRRYIRHFISIVNAKGLEFDTVVLPFLETYDLEDRLHVNRLYVGLTRARRNLILLTSGHMESANLDAVWSRYRKGVAGIAVQVGSDSSRPAFGVPGSISIGHAEEYMRFENLDVKQSQVATASAGERLLVVAGPGTGKTQISALRLVHLLDAGLRPSEVLVLSFSRSAVRTLARRIEQLASTGEATVEELRHLSIRTFDSWAFRFLRQSGAQPIELLGRSHEQNIQNVIDVLTGPQRESAIELLSHVRHVIIDEFQDLPGLRGTLVLALLDLLAPPARHGVGFTVLGDPAQAIYGFAARDSDEGASAPDDFWALLRQRYGVGLQEIVMDRNYRAVPELAALAVEIRQVLAGKTEAEQKLLEVQRQIGLLPASAFELGPEWLDCVQEGTVAILTRTNGEAMRVAQKLMGKGLEGRSVAVHLQSVGKRAPVPAWVAALLGPLKSEILVSSQFLKIHAHCLGRLGTAGCLAIGLPHADFAWLRLVRASGAPDSNTSLDMSTLRARLNWPDAFPDDAALSDKGVFISTVHQAKGMEFDSVVILESGSGKEGKPQDYPEEEANVGFVAITRAARQLARISSENIYTPLGSRSFGNGFRNRLCHKWAGWVNLEMGIAGDIDPIGFIDTSAHGNAAVVVETQAMLTDKANTLGGHKVILLKTKIEDDPARYVYNIHLQDENGPGRLLGRTTSQLTFDLLTVLAKGYSLPSLIYNLRIGDIVTVAGPDEAEVLIPEECRVSRLWLGVTLFGTGDFKPFKKTKA